MCWSELRVERGSVSQWVSCAVRSQDGWEPFRWLKPPRRPLWHWDALIEDFEYLISPLTPPHSLTQSSSFAIANYFGLKNHGSCSRLPHIWLWKLNMRRTQVLWSKLLSPFPRAFRLIWEIHSLNEGHLLCSCSSNPHLPLSALPSPPTLSLLLALYWILVSFARGPSAWA